MNQTCNSSFKFSLLAKSKFELLYSPIQRSGVYAQHKDIMLHQFASNNDLTQSQVEVSSVEPPYLDTHKTCPI